jgi:anti-anti-sigma factor
MAEQLSLVTLGGRRRPRVRIAGELDSSNAPQLARYLASINAPSIRIDLSDCTFADAAGLRALYVAYQRAMRRGAKFAIQGASGAVLRAMRLSGFDELLKTRPGDGPRALREPEPEPQ